MFPQLYIQRMNFVVFQSDASWALISTFHTSSRLRWGEHSHSMHWSSAVKSCLISQHLSKRQLLHLYQYPIIQRPIWKHTNDIVNPVVLFTPRLHDNPQVQIPRFRLGTRRLQEDIFSIMRAKVIACVGRENPRPGVYQAPVSPDIEDLAFPSVSICIA